MSLVTLPSRAGVDRTKIRVAGLGVQQRMGWNKQCEGDEEVETRMGLKENACILRPRTYTDLEHAWYAVTA